jgi:hypothetical protein
MLRQVFVLPHPGQLYHVPGQQKEIKIPITKGFMGMGGEDECKVMVQIPKLSYYAGESL